MLRAVLKQPNLEPPWPRGTRVHGTHPMHTSGQWARDDQQQSDRSEASGIDGSSSHYLTAVDATRRLLY